MAAKITPVVVTTGDNVNIPITMQNNGQNINISLSAVVKACLVRLNQEVLIPEVTLSNNATGSNWGNGLIIVEFSQAETTAIRTTGDAIIEVQIDDGGIKTSGRFQVDIDRGLIA